MAKIDEILSKSALELASMSDSDLLEYLKEAISTEPKPKPSIIGVKVKVGRKKKEVVEDDDEPDNPIKTRKSKKKLTGVELILQMKKELEELGIDVDEEENEN